ncbi:ERF family protein [[Ruminococcus] torques]|uniref:ERF family protein n=1 Tax=[Ruminococcus] torques TaxID=33039 RepID=UPI002431F0C3|nr:ERF family protein [[Ruminococcus] torques]
MTLKEKLSKIQQEMKVPKNLYNSFGKYNYRNAESILEAFKPLEDKYSVLMIVYDAVEQIGDRIYIKSVAELCDCGSDEVIRAQAYARESLEKKGMDDSQITGTASSYARKYALNGLFLLDDTKDADTDEYKNQEKKGQEDSKAKAKRITVKRETIKTICKEHGLDPEMICSMNGYNWSNMTETQLENMIGSLEKKFGDKK